VKAAIFTQTGTSEPKQHQACLDFIYQQQWILLHVVPASAPSDAVELVRAGLIDVVVAAFASKAVTQLAEAIDGRGKVYFVHPVPTLVEPAPAKMPGSLTELIVRWFRGGRSPKQIAADIGSRTCDVRDILRRFGERPG
jgi:hypothetical protein